MISRKFKKIAMILLCTLCIGYFFRKDFEDIKKFSFAKMKKRVFSTGKIEDKGRVATALKNCILEKFPENLQRSGKKEWKKILIYTNYFKARGIWPGVFQRLCLNECEESRCLLTTNRTELDLADAVLFDGNSIDRVYHKPEEERFKFPTTRRADQIYIFFSTEPPTRFKEIFLHKFDNFFNWTMTYRLDSDIIIPFGKLNRRKVKRQPAEVKHLTTEELRQKKTAIWLNSHCVKTSPRVQFHKELSKHISVDVFGNCVKRKCGTPAHMKSKKVIGKDPCEKSFSNYTFFLALENSLCKDYVTEKLYRSLNLSIIPVVFSGANYSSLVPPNSAIDSSRFSSILDLATYLKKVANNASLYNEFFKWQKDFDVDVGTPYKPLVCDLCKKLHNHHPQRDRRTYSSIKEWWINGSNCAPYTP